MTVLSNEIYNHNVSVGGGKVYSTEITNFTKSGFRIASLVNTGAGDLDCTYTLESWDKDLSDWIPEPLASFEAQPDGTLNIKLVDTFTDTQAEKYRVGIDPNSGSGMVHMSYSRQD